MKIAFRVFYVCISEREYRLYLFFIASFHFIEKMKSELFIILIVFRNILIAFNCLFLITFYCAHLHISLFLSISTLNRQSVKTVHISKYTIFLQKTSASTKMPFLVSVLLRIFASKICFYCFLSVSIFGTLESHKEDQDIVPSILVPVDFDSLVFIV